MRERIPTQRLAMSPRIPSEVNMGVLRLVATLAVVLLGTLAVLVVLDIIPRDLLQTWGIKVLLVTGIIAVTALVVSLLARKGPGE